MSRDRGNSEKVMTFSELMTKWSRCHLLRFDEKLYRALISALWGIVDFRKLCRIDEEK